MLRYRRATEEDLELYYQWAGDKEVRSNSFSSDPIPYDNHVSWFKKKIKENSTMMLLFLSEEKPVGQVRIERSGPTAVIGISIAAEFRGKGLASEMLRTTAELYIKEHPDTAIDAFIKEENQSSINAFQKAGFKFASNEVMGTSSCKKYRYHADR